MSKTMSPVTVLQNAATTVNHGTTRPAKTMGVAGYNKVVLAVTGTAGTMKLENEVSMDGSNWIKIGCTNLATGAFVNSSTGIVAVGAFEVNVAGFRLFRTNLTAVSSTTITAKASAFPV